MLPLKWWSVWRKYLILLISWMTRSNYLPQCCQASILMFEYALIPLLQWLIGLSLSFDDDLTSSVWFWLRPILSYTFGALWILPLFCLSRVINIFWFQDVANSTIKGRIISMNFPTLVADTLYSFVIQLLFLLQVRVNCRSFVVN